MQTYSKCACFFTPIKHLVLLNKTYSTDIKTIVNFKKTYKTSLNLTICCFSTP